MPLSPRAEYVLLSEARARRRNPLGTYCPHQPHPQQARFLAITGKEALYGGAAGGGKSDALLMAALQHVHVPKYAALLLRRTYADLSLPGAIMNRAEEWLSGTTARWNGTDKRWTFPSGATLSFGYLDTEKDKYRYASAEFQFIGFDELTQFPEGWYRFLFSRLRKSDVDVPLRMRAATNPGGIGHEWVRRLFLSGDPKAPPFIPAKLADNPSVDAESYLESLSRVDPTTRRQLLDGIWVRDSAGLVYRFDAEANVAPVPPSLPNYLLGVDYGYTNDTAFAIVGWRDNDPTIYGVRCWKEKNVIPSRAAEIVRDLERDYSFTRIVGDIGGLGKGYAEEARTRFSLPIQPAEKKNKRGYQDLLNGDLARGRIKLDKLACADLITQWSELPWTEDRSKESDGFDNDCADAFLYAWRACTAYHNTVPAEQPQPGTPEYARKLDEETERQQQEQWEREQRESEYGF